MVSPTAKVSLISCPNQYETARLQRFVIFSLVAIVVILVSAFVVVMDSRYQKPLDCPDIFFNYFHAMFCAFNYRAKSRIMPFKKRAKLFVP